MLLGVVDGDVRRVQVVVRAENARVDAAHNRYAIAAEELVSAQREAREAGMEMVGFYHSHPDCEAQPSQTDLAEAHWFGSAYVITSVEKGRAAATRAYVLAGASEAVKRFEEERIVFV